MTRRPLIQIRNPKFAVRNRFVLGVLLVALFAVSSTVTRAQSATATVSGMVEDQNGAVVPGVSITIQNRATSLERQATTNDVGYFSIPLLSPGTYTITARHDGFTTAEIRDVVLNVGDQRSFQVQLKTGNVNETVNVTAETPLINESPAVGTVVDRNFAENIPMNGRSFQTLIQLTPGVVVTPSSVNDSGQFSVNGQRASSNYWLVDGVSANIGINGTFQPADGAGGALGGFTVQGGTNSLVSVDALQEFKIETSTCAPEFGRSPGGQISIVTRSGSNQFHGSLFDYLRNDVLDANDWFANRSGLKKPKERQNDFGGTFSGPVMKNRTFFFFSYEGLRLRLPQVANTTVPSLGARQAAIPATRLFFNLYPLPTGPEILDANGNPTGRAPFTASYSNSSTLNATSIRVDHNLNSSLTIFGRYNIAPSELSSRSNVTSSSITNTRIATQTFTIGSTWVRSARLANELRFNYSRNHANSFAALDQFGGAVPITDAQLSFPTPFTTQESLFTLSIAGLGGPSLGNFGNNVQRQLNLVDTLSFQKRSHSFKLGVDYRRLSPLLNIPPYTQLVAFTSIPNAEAGILGTTLIRTATPASLIFKNLGLFAQDTWHARSRLTLTYGLRWDIDFAPKSGSGPALAAVTNFNDLTQLGLAPDGTPIFKTRFRNIAPRVGISYQLNSRAGRENVLRGGFGVFYDLATAEVGEASIPGTFPLGAQKILSGGTYPLSSATAAPPAISRTGSLSLFAYDPNTNLPYTLEWNIATEQALGTKQSVSASYVGAAGRRLLQTEAVTSPNTSVSSARLVSNEGTSSYNALQLQFRRRLSRGLQALASYTWSHSIDTASASSFGTPANIFVRQLGADQNRGPSDFDIHHVFSGSATYDVPKSKANGFVEALTSGWSLQSIVQAFSSPPVSANSLLFIAGTQARARADIVPGVPIYLYGPQYPGGKAINPAAFVAPPKDPTNGSFATRQGTSSRNSLRAFGAWQWDFGVHRDFSIHESLKLQFRAEMFNVLNHPNFGRPPQFVGGSPPFGVANQMLGASFNTSNTGGGSLSPLYQLGGPRSIQLALKFIF